MAFKKHGKSGTKIYLVWISMNSRCYSKTNPSYERYGGRGITVQESWRKDFLPFYTYVSNLPNYDESNLGNNGIMIDRKENDKGYVEGNLIWSNATQQVRNRSLFKNNTTGYRGVFFSKKRKAFEVRIKVNKKKHILGKPQRGR